LKNVQIINTTGGSVMREKYRSGQVSWIFKNQEEGRFNLLNTRIKCLTGLSLEFAEEYQIVNYGLGGHYIPHYDTFGKGHNVRITIIFNLKSIMLSIIIRLFTFIRFI